jgi:hypothetical protein
MRVFGRERGALRNIYAGGGEGFLHDILELRDADRLGAADLAKEVALRGHAGVGVSCRHGSAIASLDLTCCCRRALVQSSKACSLVSEDTD